MLHPVYIIYIYGCIHVFFCFQTLSVDLCCFDTILLYDGPDPSSPLLYTISQNSQSGDIVVSTTNMVYIHMQLLSHWKCRGAIMTYRSGIVMVQTGWTAALPCCIQSHRTASLVTLWSQLPTQCIYTCNYYLTGNVEGPSWTPALPCCIQSHRTVSREILWSQPPTRCTYTCNYYFTGNVKGHHDL